MLPPGLSTAQEVTKYYESVYNELISSGQATPFLYPWCSLAGVVVVTYLLIDHRRSPLLKHTRYAVFAFAVAFAVWCTSRTAARNPASGFGIGLVSCYSTFWVAALMICNDCQTDFRRIERRSDPVGASDGTLDLPVEIDSAASSGLSYSNGDARGRKTTAQAPSVVNNNIVSTPQHSELFWQSYPSGPFLARLDWVIDMLGSFRGVGWNWQISSIPPLPKSIEQALNHDHQGSHSPPEGTITKSNGLKRYTSLRQLQSASLTRFLSGYMLLDLLKTIIAHDPYFWGYVDSTSHNPPWYFPTLLATSPVAIRTYRLLVAQGCLYLFLDTIFAMGPLFYACVLGPNRIGIRGEAWMQPTNFGSLRPVFDKGLASWWGGYWHQTFRFTFEAPATSILGALGVPKRSQLGKVIALFIAFAVSGCLHASGGVSQLGTTNPLSAAMPFFLLQAVGILAQTWTTDLLTRAGVLQYFPKPIKQAANFLFAHVWLYHTAPILVDDLARGGLWLFEPIPISIFRGLGLGSRDDRWWCWQGMFHWHRGSGWWDTGIAL